MTASSPLATASPAPAEEAGPQYELPQEGLCALVDESPLADLFPDDGGQSIADGPGVCAGSRSSSSMSIGFNVDAVALGSAQGTRLVYEQFHEDYAPATDVAGAGTAAFWTGDERRVRLIAHHGNLILVVDVNAVGQADRLPEGIPERLVQLAASVFTNLSP